MDSTEPIEAHDAIEIPAGTTLTAASDDRLLGVTPADDGSGYRVETFAIEDGAVSEILVSDDLVAAAFDPNGQVVMARSSMDDPSSPSVLLFENGTEVPLEVRVIDMTW